MTVYGQLVRKARRRMVHLSLIDPDKQPPALAGRMAYTAQEAGTDGIMIGGSTAEDQTIVDRTVSAIKDACDVPAILFPGGTGGLSARADAIFYISLLNSQDPYYITGAHAESAQVIKGLGIEVIPVGYLIVEPGMTVGRMGKARLIPREDIDLATSYALVAQFFGMKMAYLEAGSGAHEHVPVEMIAQVKGSIEIPLIIGGGVRTPQDAREVCQAGADMIVQGTAMEEDNGARKRVADVIECLRQSRAI